MSSLRRDDSILSANSSVGFTVREVSRFNRGKLNEVKKVEYNPWYPCAEMPYSAPTYKTFSTLADVRALESEVLPVPTAYKPTYRKINIEATSLVASSTNKSSSATVSNSTKKSIPKIVFSSLPADQNRQSTMPKLDADRQGGTKRRPPSRPKFASVPQGFKYHYPDAELRFTPESVKESNSSSSSIVRSSSSLSKVTRHSSSRLSSTIKSSGCVMIDKQVDTNDTSTGRLIFCRIKRPKTPLLPSEMDDSASNMMDEQEKSLDDVEKSSSEDWRCSSSTLSDLTGTTSMSIMTQDLELKECADKGVMATLEEEEEDANDELDAPETSSVVVPENERNSPSLKTSAEDTSLIKDLEYHHETRWEPVIYRNYDEARMAYGWEMEVPHDPYGIKQHYLPKRLPISISLPEPVILPPEPILRKVNKSTFFHTTSPNKVLSFTLDPSFSSERFNARKNELIRRGLWKYSSRSFSFVY